MHHRYGCLLAAAIVASAWLGDRDARADTRDLDAAGARLAVVAACARHVAITVDPALSGRVIVTADAAHAEEIAQIGAATLDGEARVGLRTGLHRCWTPQPDGSFERTLTLRIRVPAAFPVSIDEDGRSDYALGAVGPLSVSASGAMTLRADAVVGDTRIDASGAATVDIGRVDADRLNVELSGTGMVHVRGGRIGAVSVADSGTAAVRIDAVADSADLSSSGTGNIDLGGVRGALRQQSSGLGRISVAGRAPAVQEDNRD